MNRMQVLGVALAMAVTGSLAACNKPAEAPKAEAAAPAAAQPVMAAPAATAAAPASGEQGNPHPGTATDAAAMSAPPPSGDQGNPHPGTQGATGAHK